MSLYGYTPLDRSRNEIRIVKFPNSNNTTDGLVHCTLLHVSLDDLLPQYGRYLEDHPTSTPTGTIRGWLQAQVSHAWAYPKIEPPVIDKWRFAAEYADDAQQTSTSEDTVPVSPRFKWGDFEAVSYCWESNERDKHVVVDDQTVWVTANLEAMLQELQYLPEAMTGMGFWIDGLCINQSDVLEKNHQVNLMGRIFSQAMSTVVWLGAPTDSSCTAIDSLCASFRPCSVSYVAGSEDHWAFHDEHSHLVPLADWGPIFQLWSRQYFRRMWIIQELALNMNMTMFVCGNRRFSRVHLQAACNAAQKNTRTISRFLGASGTTDESHGVLLRHDFVWRTANDVRSLIKLRSSGNGIDKLLHLARKAKATDPRDKVYGMLGLLPRDIAAQIEPDYTKAREKVFLELAVIMLKRCKRLDELLGWCSFAADSSLPSWVPDWSIAHERRHLRRFREAKAGGEQSSEWSLGGEKHLYLRVRAICVGHVDLASLPTRSLLPYKAVSGSRVSLPQSGIPYGRYVDRKQLKLAVERTLMHGHPKRRAGGDLLDIPWISWDKVSAKEPIVDMFPGDPDQWQYFECFRQSNAHFPVFGITLQQFFAREGLPFTPDVARSPSDYPADTTNTHIQIDTNAASANVSIHQLNLRRTTVALQHRRLVTTQTGFLGLAPDEVEVGDTVAIIVGCNYPVLLRPYNDGFKYVGECYVDGLMHGEGIDAASRGNFQFDDILIL